MLTARINLLGGTRPFDILPTAEVMLQLQRKQNFEGGRILTEVDSLPIVTP